MNNRDKEASAGLFKNSESIQIKDKVEPNISEISQETILGLLTICNLNHDYSETDKYLINNKKRAKALKKLQEISSKSFKIFLKFVNTNLEFVFKVIEKNIFRPLPDNISDYFTEDIDPECNHSKYEPDWIYLDGIYDLLFFMIRHRSDIKNLKNYLTLEFITKLVDLIQSPNYSERQAIRNLYFCIYESHLYLKNEILKISKYFLMTKIQENYNYLGVDELLNSHLSIVIHFPIPLNKDHVEFFKVALVPLYGTHFSHLLESNLFTCCHHILMKDLSLAVYLIEYLLSHWPIVSCRKQVFFLNNIKKLISMFDLSSDQILFTKILKRLALCYSSPNLHVIYSAIIFVETESFLTSLKTQKQVFFPLIVNIVEESSKTHWNNQIKEIFNYLKDILISIDSDYYELILKVTNDIRLSNSVNAVDSMNNRKEIESRWEALTIRAIEINPSLIISKVPYRTDHVVGLNNRNGLEMTSDNLVLPGLEFIKLYEL